MDPTSPEKASLRQDRITMLNEGGFDAVPLSDDVYLIYERQSELKRVVMVTFQELSENEVLQALRRDPKEERVERSQAGGRKPEKKETS
jgi:hypothetical protein